MMPSEGPPALQMREGTAGGDRRKHELCIVAVSRIQGWLKHSGKQLSDLFSQIDTDGSGDFDVSEFRAARTPLNKRRCRAAHTHTHPHARAHTLIPQPSDNEACSSEQGLLSIGLTFCDDTVQALMALMDADGGGSVDRTEFVQWIERFAEEELGSTVAVLAGLCEYMEKSGETIAEICGSDDLSVQEFHGALTRIGIKASLRTAREIMTELAMDRIHNRQELTAAEVNVRLETYRRKRRAFASKVLNDVFAQIQKTKACATRIFARVDADGTGMLDVFELQEALLRMGQELTPEQVHDVMAELDCDCDSSVGMSEFLDKLKQAESNRAAEMRRCRALFEHADADGSGQLDRAEVRRVAEQMGLREQLSENADFLSAMIADIRGSVAESPATAAAPQSDRAADYQVSFEDFMQWYFATGKSYLDRPCYAVQPALEAPTKQELAALFASIRSDRSGSVDLAEVQHALRTVWPYIDPLGFQRAFAAADQNCSGCIDEVEFKHLCEFLVYLNEWRHTIQELEDALGTQVGEDEFYVGCQCLKLSVNGDGASKHLFQEECRRKSSVDLLTFDEYVQWAVRYACVAQRDRPPPETETQRKARVCAEMSVELEQVAGEYGDVHMIDLIGVLTKDRGQSSGPETAASKLRASMKRVTSTALECSELVKRGIEYSINQNDGFPTLSDASLRMMVRMCRKEEFFTGQNIVTQGEVDTNYYVLRRGRVQVLVDDAPIRTLEWGMAFGEIGLLLNTKRTASVVALTPAEVYVLDRAGYETVLSLLPEDQRLGALSKALNKFWELMTGPDGSQRGAPH